MLILTYPIEPYGYCTERVPDTGVKLNLHAHIINRLRLVVLHNVKSKHILAGLAISIREMFQYTKSKHF
jgi:hypothetical protein